MATSQLNNCSRAYLKITRTDHGIECIPADITTFQRAQGVGERIEKKIAPMPDEITATSVAISMKRIADSLEVLEEIAYRTYRKTHGRKRWWRREKRDDTTS